MKQKVEVNEILGKDSCWAHRQACFSYFAVPPKLRLRFEFGVIRELAIHLIGNDRLQTSVIEGVCIHSRVDFLEILADIEQNCVVVISWIVDKNDDFCCQPQVSSSSILLLVGATLLLGTLLHEPCSRFSVSNNPIILASEQRTKKLKES